MTGDADATAGVTWVLGASGLLGSAVVRDLAGRGRPRASRTPVPWADPRTPRPALLDEARGAAGPGGGSLVRRRRGRRHRPGRAGRRGARCSSGSWRSGRRAGGTVFFASSAGGVYAGSAGAAASTSTTDAGPAGAVRPRQAARRGAVTEHARRTGVGLLIGRIANLYGPGQDVGQAAGTDLARCAARRRPPADVGVYVSLDTLRDYLFVDDAAAMVREGLDAVAARRGRAHQGAGQRAGR